MKERRRYPYAVLDVFTDRPLHGNGLAVVQDADGLDDDAMQSFARETRLSETTFVQASARKGADYRNRIFTVRKEVPFAGHPSLGTAVAVARSRGAGQATFVQETGAGLQPVDVRLDGDSAYASMLQEPPSFGPEVDALHVLAAVGLVPGDAHRDLPPQVVSTGLPTLVTPVATARCVADAKPDFELLDALAARHGADNIYLVCLHEEGPVRARMFTSFVEGGEDPATGSAAGALSGYLAEHGRETRIEISQGVEIGRPSRLMAVMEGDRPRVGGSVVSVIDGAVSL